jgi:hypothetical protein
MRLMAAHQRYYVAILREILDEGVRSGHLRPSNTTVVAELVGAGMDRLWQPSFRVSREPAYEHAVAELTQIIRSALVIETD